MKGEHIYRKTSNSYSLNLKLALGKMAPGIAPSNMAQLLSFLNIPNCKSLSCRYFRKIELTIDPTLRKIAIYSKVEYIEDEIRLNLNNEN